MGSSPIQANLESQIVRLDHFISLLQGISEASAVPNDASMRGTLLHASVIKVINSGMAVRMLANAECVEEILTIGRTMVEVSVNAAYLQHAAPREFERFLHFHPESAAKNVTMLPSPIETPRREHVVSRLGKKILRSLPTLPSKRVDPSWSSRSLLERATIADESNNIPVMNLLVRRCYPRGHAAMLGAVDSIGYFIAALHGSDDASHEVRTVALTEAIFGVNLCLFTLSFYLSAFFRLNMDRAIEQAARAETPGAYMPILGADARQ